jgi:hypothetical protein
MASSTYGLPPPYPPEFTLQIELDLPTDTFVAPVYVPSSAFLASTCFSVYVDPDLPSILLSYIFRALGQHLTCHSLDPQHVHFDRFCRLFASPSYYFPYDHTRYDSFLAFTYSFVNFDAVPCSLSSTHLLQFVHQFFKSNYCGVVTLQLSFRATAADILADVFRPLYPSPSPDIDLDNVSDTVPLQLLIDLHTLVVTSGPSFVLPSHLQISLLAFRDKLVESDISFVVFSEFISVLDNLLDAFDTSVLFPSADRPAVTSILPASSAVVPPSSLNLVDCCGVTILDLTPSDSAAAVPLSTASTAFVSHPCSQSDCHVASLSDFDYSADSTTAVPLAGSSDVNYTVACPIVVTTLTDDHLAPSSDFCPPPLPPVNLVTNPSPNFSAPCVSTPLLRSSDFRPTTILGSAFVSGLPATQQSAVSDALSLPPIVSVLPVSAHFDPPCATVLSSCVLAAPTSDSAVFAYFATPDLCPVTSLFGSTAVPITATVSGLVAVPFPPMHLCHDFFWPRFAHLLPSLLPPVYKFANSTVALFPCSVSLCNAFERCPPDPPFLCLSSIFSATSFQNSHFSATFPHFLGSFFAGLIGINPPSSRLIMTIPCWLPTVGVPLGKIVSALLNTFFSQFPAGAICPIPDYIFADLYDKFLIVGCQILGFPSAIQHSNNIDPSSRPFPTDICFFNDCLHVDSTALSTFCSVSLRQLPATPVLPIFRRCQQYFAVLFHFFSTQFSSVVLHAIHSLFAVFRQCFDTCIILFSYDNNDFGFISFVPVICSFDGRLHVNAFLPALCFVLLWQQPAVYNVLISDSQFYSVSVAIQLISAVFRPLLGTFLPSATRDDIISGLFHCVTVIILPSDGLLPHGDSSVSTSFRFVLFCKLPALDNNRHTSPRTSALLIFSRNVFWLPILFFASKLFCRESCHSLCSLLSILSSLPLVSWLQAGEGSYVGTTLPLPFDRSPETFPFSASSAGEGFSFCNFCQVDCSSFPFLQLLPFLSLDFL